MMNGHCVTLCHETKDIEVNGHINIMLECDFLPFCDDLIKGKFDLTKSC
jgi:hypothetical protein